MLQIRLLGQLDIRTDGKRVVISSRAGQSILAYLVLSAGTPHRREKLAGLFWPDSPDENARKNLRQELWRIRKAITTQKSAAVQYIVADEYTIMFDASAEFWLDVTQLERTLPPDASLDERLNRASSYVGELLPGFYDDWVVLERERVHALFERKLQQLLERLIAEKRWTVVLEWGEKWIAFGQTPEPAFRALLLAYAALGDRAKLATVYERCQAALDGNLGVEPSAETRKLYEQLLLGQPVDGVDLKATQVAPLRARHADEPPAPGNPPFKGLRYFEELDADLFYGRELLTAKLVQHVRESTFLAIVVGASGSGKSSVVRAGLVPALKRSQPSVGGVQWAVHVLTPTAHPLEALAIALTHDTESVTAAATLLDDLSHEPRSLALYFKRLAYTGKATHTLIVIDQFEELFTLCRDEFEREAFIDNLLTALVPGPSPLPVEPGEWGASPRRIDEGLITLVITIRADFYAHLADYPELRDAVAKQQEYIGPMTADELRRAIEEPARRGGWEFEPGLVDLILRDLGDEPGALPLLSHALLETWQRRSGRTLTLKGYASAGGVRGAVALTAETVHQYLSADQRAIVRDILLRLTELGEGTDDTRRRASLSELTAQSDRAEPVRVVLNILAQARLITLSADTAEVAHEALIREWPTLRDWLAQDRDGLLLHRHLTEATHEWELLEGDPGAVYRGARLAQAAEWVAANPNALNARENAFLVASQAQAQREEQEREANRQRELEAAYNLAEEQRGRAEEQAGAAKQLRRRAQFLAAAFVLAVVLAGSALVLGQQASANANTAAQERTVAFARELAAAAISNLPVDPQRSILLALQAVNTSRRNGQPVLVEVEEALHRAVQSSRVVATFSGNNASLWTVALSRAGTRLATVGTDGTAQVWDIATGQVLVTLPTKVTDNLNGTGAVFSADGTQLLTVSDGNTATLWDISTGNAVLVLTGHTSGVTSVAISPDGKLFATASDDMTLKVWEAATGKEVNTLTGHDGSSLVLAFSADVKRVFAGSDGDGYAIAWDVATGKELFRFSGQARVTGVDSLAASPDGTRLATGEFDTTVKVWDSATGRQLFRLFGHSSQVVSVAFSADGKLLASASEDGTAKLWDALTGKELLTLSGHTSGVLGIAFSPDGKRVYTVSRDGTAKIWDISATAGSDWMNLAGHADRIGFVTYSPDGTRLATFGLDGTAKVWDAFGSQNVLTLQHGDTRCVGNVGYSPDGNRLAVAGGTEPRVFDAVSGLVSLTLAPFNDNVCNILFSPDGTRLAAGSDAGLIRIYDSSSGKMLVEFIASPAGIEQIAFSPDGKSLATANDDGATVWDTTSGQKLLTFSGHGAGVRLSGVAFSPDGKLVATAGNDSAIRIWDSQTGVEAYLLAGHSGPAFAVAFSPDSKLLATASVDRTIKIWSLPGQGEHVAQPLTLYGHTAAVYRVAFSPDGSRLATVGRNPIVRIYALKIGDLITNARSRLTRELTPDECLRFLHAQQCPSVGGTK